MRIALCIAGETREYNKFFGPNTIITHLMENGHTVDVFGHTWAHCEKPVEDVFKFKRLLIEDQLKIVEDWVNVNPQQRQFSYWDDENNCEGPLEDIELTRAKIGQHISGLKCLQMPETNDYDVFIRWRWDLTLQWDQHWISKEADLYSQDDKNKIVKLMFDQWIDYLETKNDLPVILTDGHGWVGHYNWTIQDTHFYLNKVAHRNIKNLKWETAIERVWNETCKCSYHMLWNHLLIREAKCMIRQPIPNVTVFTKTERHKNNELHR